MDQTPSLTIFFPCLNDAEALGELLPRADQVARELTEDYEILVIDDGSDEENRKLLKELEKTYSRLSLVFHRENQGYGGALRSGFRHATKDWVFYTDGDGQYDIFELRELWSRRAEGADVINGYKRARQDAFHRVFLGGLYRRFTRIFFKTPIRDVNCDFRLIRRQVFQHIQLRQTGAAICLELVKKIERAGFRFLEVPVHHYARSHGQSRFFNPLSLIKAGWGVLSLTWELAATKRERTHVCP